MPTTSQIQAHYAEANTNDLTENRNAAIPLTDLLFLEPGSEFPPPSQKKRMDRYEKNRQLWKGNHDLVYGNWWRTLREDSAASMELVFNWHKRLSTLWADLLVGEPPRFFADQDGRAAAKKPSKKPEESSKDPDKKGESTAPEDVGAGADPIQEAIDRLSGKDDNGYVTTLYEVALDVSRYGDGLVKVTLEEEGAQIWAQPPTQWYPIVDPSNLRKVTHHVLAWKFSRNDVDFVYMEIHRRGSIETRVHTIEGNTIGPPVPIETFTTVPPIQNTKVKEFLVVPFAGLRASDEIFGVDDYMDVDTIVMALEVRAAQINRVLDKHTDPSMYGPSDQLETDEHGNTVFKAADRYFEVDEQEVPPGYVTWDGQLEAQFNEIDTLIKQLYIISETSPAAFGQLESGLAESGSALRRLMQAPLAKVARITMRFDPAAKRALKIAAEIERNNGRGTPRIDSVHVQWQDGLPADPKEQAETEEIRIRSGTSAQTSSIRRLDGGTQEEAEAEFERIAEEAQAKADAALAQADAEAAIAAKHQPAPATGSTPGQSGAVKPESGGKPSKEKK